MEPKAHWEHVYATKPINSVSWFEPHAAMSLNFIQRTDASKRANIIDVGGGTSVLCDDLLEAGYSNLTVLDISESALHAAQARLGARAQAIAWLVGDITKLALPVHQYDIWHDRAVFHFLTAPEDRNAYVSALLRSVRPGGHVIVATFASDGPTQCSGLSVMRYSPTALHHEFGAMFSLIAHERQAHRTPSGATQQFIYCYCRLPES